jgi:predicted Zn-dependent protease
LIDDYGRNATQTKRTIQHEISHIWGVLDEQCTPGQQCVVSYDNTLNFKNDINFDNPNIWCDNCRSIIIAKRAQKPQ